MVHESLIQLHSELYITTGIDTPQGPSGARVTTNWYINRISTKKVARKGHGASPQVSGLDVFTFRPSVLGSSILLGQRDVVRRLVDVFLDDGKVEPVKVKKEDADEQEMEMLVAAA